MSKNGGQLLLKSYKNCSLSNSGPVAGSQLRHYYKVALSLSSTQQEFNVLCDVTDGSMANPDPDLAGKQAERCH